MTASHMKPFLTGIILLAASVSATAADAPADRVRSSEARQQQLRQQTQRVSEQLSAVIAEFERNGMGDSEDARTLRAIQMVLGHLSAEEMDRVVALLQQARNAEDPDVFRRHLADAFTSQKTIIAHLRQLLIEYQRQQAMFELSTRFARLAERQGTNLRAAVELARGTVGRPPGDFDSAQRSSLQVQQAEQNALEDEVGFALDVLAALVQADVDREEKGLVRAKQYAQEQRLTELMSSAVSDLNGGNLFRAATTERAARDHLRELARLVAPPRDLLAQLRQAAEALDRAIAEQQSVIDQTREAHGERPDLTRPEERQAELVDQVDLTRRDLEEVSPEVAKDIQDSQDHMQEARAAMNERERDEAVQEQSTALAQLEQAREKLAEQIAEEEKRQQEEFARYEEMMQELAALNEARQKVEELIGDQKETAERTQAAADEAEDAPGTQELAEEQQALADRTDEVRQELPESAQDASEALGQAEDEMKQAHEDLNEPDAEAARPHQDEAIKGLEQAMAALDEQIADLQQALGIQPELEQQMAALSEAIQQAQHDLGDVQQELPDVPDLFGDLRREQQEISDAIDQMREANQEHEAVQQALEQAQEAADQAVEALENRQAAPAAAAMAEAQQAMEQARQAQPEPPAEAAQDEPQPDLAELPQLQQQQADLRERTEALAALQEGMDLAQFVEPLEQIGQDLSQAMQQSGPMTPEMIQWALEQAQHALENAAEASRQHDAGEAHEQTDQAQDALAQALAAIGMMQAGLMPGAPMAAMPMPGGPPMPMPGMMPGIFPGMFPGMGPPEMDVPGLGEREDAAAAEAGGPRWDIRGQGRHIALPERDRQALQQGQSERYPEEYGTMIEQYLRNLSEAGE